MKNDDYRTCDIALHGVDAPAKWNALHRTAQAAPSDRERSLELACKEVLATPSFGALRSADAVDTIKMVRAALAAAPDKPQYAALEPEPWGGPGGDE